MVFVSTLGLIHNLDITRENYNILMNASLLNNIETEDFDIFELDNKSNKKTLIIIVIIYLIDLDLIK